MGNFHCIPSNCATVHYREYLPPKIRWRYPDEEWNEKIGDNFTIKDESKKYDLDPTKRYKITGKAIVSDRVPPASSNLPAKWVAGQEIEIFLLGSYAAPIYKFEPVVVDKNLNVNLTYNHQRSGNLKAKYCYKETSQWIPRTRLDEENAPRIKSQGGSYYEPAINLNIGVYDLTFTEDGEALPCLNEIPEKCIFTVFLKGETVHQEERETCPEVEQINCRLDDQLKAVEINKIPYLERVEVVPWRYQVGQGLLVDGNFGLLVRQADIPDECLNIYKNNTVTIVPQSKVAITPTNTPQAGFGLIQQICSAPGCLPPKYEVICNCDNCEKCPPNTCAVECEEQVCCYEVSTGEAIKSIPKSQYCKS